MVCIINTGESFFIVNNYKKTITSSYSCLTARRKERKEKRNQDQKNFASVASVAS